MYLLILVSIMSRDILYYFYFNDVLAGLGHGGSKLESCCIDQNNEE